MKNFFRLTDRRIQIAAGIGLVGGILDNAGFQKQFSKVRSEDKRSRKQIDCGSIMTSFIGLLCMGNVKPASVKKTEKDISPKSQ